VDIFGAEVRAVGPEQIAFVSFTRIACNEARDRVIDELGIPPRSLIWCRTIHSAALKLLGGSVLAERDDDDDDGSKIVSDAQIRKFALQHGYRLTAKRPEDEEDGVPEGDDLFRRVYELSKILCVGIEDALRMLSRVAGPVSRERAHLYAARYDAFKQKHRLIDFNDMISRCFELQLFPPIEVLILDEAQDSGPDHQRLLEMWASRCNRVYVAGDDDQAIYGFSGGSSSWLSKLAELCQTEILAQSFRVPRIVHRMAQDIIGRVQQRVPKLYRPSDLDGEIDVIALDGLAARVAGVEDVLVIARTWRELAHAKRALQRAGVPFLCRGRPKWSPLGDADLVAAVQAALDLVDGQRVSPRAFEALLKMVPSGPLAPRRLAVKARAKENQHWMDASAMAEWELSGLLEALRRDPVGPLTASPAHAAMSTLVRHHHGRLPRAFVRLSTIHQAKGTEADVVAVLSSWGSRPARSLSGTATARDCEHRLAYVAVTRTRKRLLLVRPRVAARAYPWPRVMVG
jgi:DNA helicase-2/ATP-dependent DNA helicase PcrA